MARSDEVVQRFEGLHTGFNLVDYEEVGLPFFELRLDVMALKRSELAVVDEYVLRLADLGLRASHEIEGLLGLQEAVVRRSVLALLQSDLVDYPPGTSGREIRLSSAGKAALEERVQDIPQRTELRIGFDRLLWKLSPRWMNEWDNPRRFKDSDTRLIPPRRRRRPEIEEIEMVALNRELAELPKTRRSEVDVDVVQMLSLGARTKYLPALMLVFVADDQSAIRVSFVVDEHHSQEHDRAFEEVGGLARLGIELDDPNSLDAERPSLPAEIEELRPAEDEVIELDRRLRQTTRAYEAAVADAGVAEVEQDVRRRDPSTRERLDDREREVEELRVELEQLKAHRAALPIRSIPTFEHRNLLEEALDTASSRLLIIAPWIRNAVVDDDFVAALRRLSKRGVTIHIGYGIKRADVEGHDAAALERLTKLAGDVKKLTLTELGDTHAKILIWDAEMVVTSFNWLSFRGDSGRKYRQEEGTLIRHRDYVDVEYERHRARIESTTS